MVNTQHEDKISVSDMRVLRWMCGESRWDRIINDNIRECLDDTIIEKVVETRLRFRRKK